MFNSAPNLSPLRISYRLRVPRSFTTNHHMRPSLFHALQLANRIPPLPPKVSMVNTRPMSARSSRPSKNQPAPSPLEGARYCWTCGRVMCKSIILFFVPSRMSFYLFSSLLQKHWWNPYTTFPQSQSQKDSAFQPPPLSFTLPPLSLPPPFERKALTLTFPPSQTPSPRRPHLHTPKILLPNMPLPPSPA